MSEIIEALNTLEKEKNISKEDMIEAIERAITSACEKDFGKEGVDVHMDRETGEIKVFANMVVVEEIQDPHTDILIENAKHIDPDCELGEEVRCEVTTKDFGRIAAQKARGIILQSIKEKEKDAVYTYFKAKEHQIVTGIVQRFVGYNMNVSLDNRTDTILSSKEMIPGERYRVGDRIKLYIVEVKKTEKGGFKIVTSRTHPEFVKRLFEKEVAEISDGTVEIMSISREPGSRSKIAVRSADPDVDAVGACVGLNSNRINNVVEDLNGEKIDVIEWDENPAIFIQNSLRPSPVISVDVYDDDKFARVIVPDEKLSLAIGKEGQNARLAARLTNYKIDIKSESQAAEEDEYYDEYYEDEEDEALTDEDVSAAVEEYEAEQPEESEEEAAAEDNAEEAEAEETEEE
ncbi:MAG: transcription termination/antitermination protein NusA [Eubacterium sp.]|nr:transcription termination/antitermination protein NusA [Eubacterium sp.]